MPSVLFDYEGHDPPMWSADLEIIVKEILDRRNQDEEPWTVKPREFRDRDAWKLEFTHEGRTAVLILEREDADIEDPALSGTITDFVSGDWPATPR